MLSIPSPLSCALNTTVICYPGNTALPSISDLLGGGSVQENLLPRHIRAVIQLVFLYNMRVSELLDVTNLDVIKPDRVLCHGKKGSYSYIIFVPGLDTLIDNVKTDVLTYRIFNYTYLKVYNWCIKIGIGSTIKNRKHKTVLHTSRFQIANKCYAHYSLSDGSGVLRHRNKKTISYYLK